MTNTLVFDGSEALEHLRAKDKWVQNLSRIWVSGFWMSHQSALAYLLLPQLHSWSRAMQVHEQASGTQ